MVKIRLSRIGAKGQPYYRVVVVNERSKRDGKVIESIGSYNPRTEPSTFEIDKERLKYWRGVGAQLTEPVLVLLGEAKPKKHQPRAKKEETAAPTKEAAEVQPEATPTEGAAEVKVDAPETTPEASAELAQTAEASEKVSPEATPEEVAQTIENTEDVVTENLENAEKQPQTQDQPVAAAEQLEETASDVESPEGEKRAGPEPTA